MAAGETSETDSDKQRTPPTMLVPPRRAGRRSLTAPIWRFQRGVINDYVTWMVLGLAAIGGVLALIIR